MQVDAGQIVVASCGVAHSVSVITKGGIDWAVIGVAQERQALGVRTWSNTKSGQHHPSRHVHGSVGGSNRSCLTVVSEEGGV